MELEIASKVSRVVYFRKGKERKGKEKVAPHLKRLKAANRVKYLSCSSGD